VEARKSLQALAGAPMDARDEELIGTLRPLVDGYLQAVSRILEVHGTTPIEAEQEQKLANSREAALVALHRFIQSQTAKQNDALGAMANARARVRDVFFGVSLLALLAFLLVALITVRSIRGPARELVAVAAALQAGDYRPALKWAEPDRSGSPEGSEMTSIGRAFGTAASVLEHRELRLRADADIAVATGSSLDKTEVGRAALQRIADHVRAEVAVLYWAAADGQMLPIAQRALNGAAQPFPAGEGLPGYAAQRREPVIIRDIPQDTPFAIRVGYDSAPPRSIAVVPVQFQNDLLGVMVLATLHDFDAEAVAFLQAASRQLSVGFQNVKAHEEIEQLVADLRERNERIQAQSEELQVQNEEIQAQNEEITAQQEELQAQNEELQAQNEEIQNQNIEISTRSGELEELTARLVTQTRMLEAAD
jgi:two-component system chemotaxis sensor kinase CheA